MPSTCTCDSANGYSPSPDRAFCRRYDRAEAGAPDVDTTLHEESSLRLGWNWSAEVVPRIDDGDDGVDPSQSLEFEIGTGSHLLLVLITSSGAGQATLAMWVDLDGDQVYAPNELLATHSGALVQGSNWWWLEFAVPASLQPGERDMRLRLFPDVFEASPTGVYLDGEVEDYVVSLVPRCGDGFIVAPEQCDQGSADPPPLDDGDGCSTSCLIEPGWTCSNVPSICEFTGPPVPTSRPAGTWMLGALLVLLGAYQIVRRVEGTA